MSRMDYLLEAVAAAGQGGVGWAGQGGVSFDIKRCRDGADSASLLEPKRPRTLGTTRLLEVRAACVPRGRGA